MKSGSQTPAVNTKNGVIIGEIRRNSSVATLIPDNQY